MTWSTKAKPSEQSGMNRQQCECCHACPFARRIVWMFRLAVQMRVCLAVGDRGRHRPGDQLAQGGDALVLGATPGPAAWLRLPAVCCIGTDIGCRRGTGLSCRATLGSKEHCCKFGVIHLWEPSPLALCVGTWGAVLDTATAAMYGVTRLLHRFAVAGRSLEDAVWYICW